MTLPLPAGIRSRRLDGINGLSMHLLEAGDARAPCVLLLHGFPELAYSWRKLMLPLAEAGYHVIAPDQRGYGRSTGWDADYDTDLRPFGLDNLVRDAFGVVRACGHTQVAAVVGHDFGSPVAAWCALLRPDVFRAVALMSAPFAGPPDIDTPAGRDIHADLAALSPPRKHYHQHYSGREANDEMWHAPQGVHRFLRAYYHMKSADWPHNQPVPLAEWSAAELARLPRYYVMDRDQGMAATVAPHEPAAALCNWLPDDELAVYAAEYQRTGFQGGLNWYRCTHDARCVAALQLFAGRSIDVPACFIAGASDWGVHQRPGALQVMQQRACSRFVGLQLLDRAGHWVQQEQPEATVAALLGFLHAARAAAVG